jgi:cobalt/nickel transport system permease protein
MLKGLQDLKMPKVMVMIISFTYRYLFVLTEEIFRMRRARDSRSFGNLGRKSQIRTVGNIIGALFVRSYDRAERVYAAMVSRGFLGEIKTTSQFILNTKDVAFLFLFFSYLLTLRLLV